MADKTARRTYGAPGQEVSYRRLQRAGCVVLLAIAFAFLVAAAVDGDVRLVFVAIWPGAIGVFGTIAFRPGADIDWVGRWLR